jgi:hypothetical protein
MRSQKALFLRFSEKTVISEPTRLSVFTLASTELSVALRNSSLTRIKKKTGRRSGRKITWNRVRREKKYVKSFLASLSLSTAAFFFPPNIQIEVKNFSENKVISLYCSFTRSLLRLALESVARGKGRSRIFARYRLMTTGLALRVL